MRNERYAYANHNAEHCLMLMDTLKRGNSVAIDFALLKRGQF